jgi:hypothetical protein
LQIIMQVVAADVCASRILTSATAPGAAAPMAATVKRIANRRTTASAWHASTVMITRFSRQWNPSVAITTPPHGSENATPS